MEFVFLGGVAVLAGGGPIDLGPARQRCVLAALAVDAGRVVSVERLIDRVWGGSPPLRARATLLNYLSRLRLLLASEGAGAGSVTIARRPGGYSLQAERSAIDLLRFHDLCQQARAVDDEQAASLLRQALELWRGEALTGVDGAWVEAERDRLHQRRKDAECDLTDVLLRLGHGEDLVATLTTRTARWPLDERVAGQLVLALHRAGRTADALAHYRRLRDRLVEQLGTEPGIALQDLHQRVLDADPALIPPSAAITGGTAEQPVPRQLPAPPRWFTGRRAELDRLDQTLADERPLPVGAGAETSAATVVISAIGGAGGIGKTCLALAWAHHHAEQFLDGQLFVDLRGFSPTEQPVVPEAALFGFLTALGVAPARIPADLDAKAALYRSLVADRKMLVVLDNAATPGQVVPLLPGTPTCTVLITGRTKLASLIDRYGARHLTLDVLTRDEARALLAARLGEQRVAAEPGATDELVDLCGRYPLALSITARHATTSPQVPLAEFTAELRDLGLDMLDNDDPTASLPMVLSWSLHRLTSEQRTVFALLGIAPGPDIDLPAAASLTGLTQAQTRKALRVLEDHSLLDRHPHGRYSMHDLVRAYAATTARDHLTDPVRLAALERVVDFYLHTAHTAALLLDPHRTPIPFDPPVPGSHPHPLPDLPAGLAWLDTHHPHLLAAQHTAADHHRHHAVWHLAWTLPTFHQRRGHRHDSLAVWQAAADAASHLSDPAALILANRLLGHAHAELGRHEQAVEHLHHALALAEQHHDATQQAHAHHNLVVIWERRGDNQQALEHAHKTLALYRTLGLPPAWEADALNAVGWLAARLGDYDTAREHCRQALDLQRQHHHPDGEATTQDSLGYIEHRTGHHDRAIDHYLQALTLFRTLGVTSEVAHTLDRLGHPHLALGQHDQARSVWQEALELYREQGRDEDAGRVRRQLDDLASAPNSVPTGRGS